MIREPFQSQREAYSAVVSGRVIISLCSGTGAWECPYVEAGYTVISITKAVPSNLYAQQLNSKVIIDDVRTWMWKGAGIKEVHGVLCAPPCTHLARSGARYWKDKGPAALREAMSVVDACIRLISIWKPKWWALENPIGGSTITWKNLR